MTNRVVKQLANDEGSASPKAKIILKNNLYVDDVIFDADTVKGAIQLRKQVSHQKALGGFHLKNWASNNEPLFSNCLHGDHERTSVFSGEDIQLKALELCWDPTSDNLKIQVKTPCIEQPSNRKLLAVIARLYDPLGWLSLVILVAQRMMHELWIRKLDWDDPIPDDLTKHWNNFYGELKGLENIRIPRWTGHRQTSL